MVNFLFDRLFNIQIIFGSKNKVWRWIIRFVKPVSLRKNLTFVNMLNKKVRTHKIKYLRIQLLNFKKKIKKK